ncbi:MAG: hypothetical protein ABIF71_12885 [Planctomycetota bacterium]
MSDMNPKREDRVDIKGASIHVKGNDGEEVHVSPAGVHVMDGRSEVKVSFFGIRIKDGNTNIDISVWKPLVGCGMAVIIFLALLTMVVVGIVKLLLR